MTTDANSNQYVEIYVAMLAALRRTVKQARGAMLASGSDAEFVDIALAEAEAVITKAEGLAS